MTCDLAVQRRPSETFLAGLGFWLVAVAVVCDLNAAAAYAQRHSMLFLAPCSRGYLLLTISSTTFLMKEVPDSTPKKYEAISKFPGSRALC